MKNKAINKAPTAKDAKEIPIIGPVDRRPPDALLVLERYQFQRKYPSEEKKTYVTFESTVVWTVA